MLLKDVIAICSETPTRDKYKIIIAFHCRYNTPHFHLLHRNVFMVQKNVLRICCEQDSINLYLFIFSLFNKAFSKTTTI
jgi:hypothetical protein